MPRADQRVQEHKEKEGGFREYLLGLARDLDQQLRPISENLDQVLRNIEVQARRESAEGMLDYLAPLRVAALFSKQDLARVVFEEPCTRHSSRGPHDVVLYTHTDVRVVNEVKRLTETLWSRKEKEAATDCGKRTGLLHEMREDPDKSTGSHDIMLKEVWKKRLQFDPGQPNVLWFVSSNDFYDDQKVEDVAYFLTVQRDQLPEGQPGRAHQKPKDLTALGWLWDGDRSWTTEVPHCFLMDDHPSLGALLSPQQQFVVKKIARSSEVEVSTSGRAGISP